MALAVLVGAGVAGATDDTQDPRAGKDGGDLRSGAVFTMTNARKANEVVAFAREKDGRLRRAGAFATGGQGSGSFEDTNNGLILGSSQGESAPDNHTEDGDLLVATNARSDSITVFRVLRDRLQTVTGTGPSPMAGRIGLAAS